MLPEALALCLVIFLMILFVFFYVCNRTFFSALAGGCLIALIVLIVAYPPFLLIAEEASWKTILYCVLIFIFIFIILIYIIVSIIKDRRNCDCPTRTSCDSEAPVGTANDKTQYADWYQPERLPEREVLESVLTSVDQTETWYEVPN